MSVKASFKVYIESYVLIKFFYLEGIYLMNIDINFNIF
jgi:hypothetical protein